MRGIRQEVKRQMGTQKTIGEACRLLTTRGHAYRSKNKYVIVQFFSKSLVEVDKLRECFGGNYYSHGVGFIWVLQQRDDVRKLAEILEPHLPEVHDLALIYQLPEPRTKLVTHLRHPD